MEETAQERRERFARNIAWAKVDFIVSFNRCVQEAGRQPYTVDQLRNITLEQLMHECAQNGIRFDFFPTKVIKP